MTKFEIIDGVGIIPERTITIPENAFGNCTDLISIVIPESVTVIGYGAFMGCKNLTGIIIPESVKKLCDCAFNECSGLTSIFIPKSVTDIGFEAFGSCTGLTSIRVAEENTKYDSRNNCNAIIETVTNNLIASCYNTIIPNSVTKIGDGAFQGYTGSCITIPESVREIGDYAFDICKGLTNIVIPKSITKIGNDVFLDCDSLKEILVPAKKADFFRNLLPEEFHSFIVETAEVK